MKNAELRTQEINQGGEEISFATTRRAPWLNNNPADYAKLGWSMCRHFDLLMDHAMGQQTAEFDGFQTRKLYPDAEPYRWYEASWSIGGNRTFSSGDRDPQDLAGDLILRGSGTKLTIDGAGIGQLSGMSPRMYFYDEQQHKKWKDVEVTFNARRIKEIEDDSSGTDPGFIAGVRSEHQLRDASPCRLCAYYGRVLYDGRVDFKKELAHLPGSTGYTEPLPKMTVKWKEGNGTIDSVPKGIWIGYKFVVWNSLGNNAVHLELYRDQTDGKDGGTWELLRGHSDLGNWPVKDLQHCPGSPTRQLLCPSTSVFIRNDKLGACDYKKISIREIAHP